MTSSTTRLALGVPVIDVSILDTTPLASLTPTTPCVVAISAACRTWGFFQITHHGVDPSLMAAFYAEQLAFFELPVSTKRGLARTLQNSKGWYNDEQTKQKVDWKEGFDMGAQDGDFDGKGLDGFNVMPSSAALPRFTPVMRRYFGVMEELARKLVACMALGLGLPYYHFFANFDAVHSSYLRLNHYPVCPEPGKHRAISEHTDAGAVTVLSQGPYMVQSLQVLKPDDGVWYDVEPIEGAFTINTGDIMQVWSNDLYRAPLHRVKAQPDKVRVTSRR